MEESVSKVYCTDASHGYGDHTAGCMPPADPSDRELRLLRAVFGLCPDCDETRSHVHEGGIAYYGEETY